MEALLQHEEREATHEAGKKKVCDKFMADNEEEFHSNAKNCISLCLELKTFTGQ
jgi:hypothetical protein